MKPVGDEFVERKERIFAIRKTKPVRAERVEACSRAICDAKRGSAALVIVRLCPSTGSGRTARIFAIRKTKPVRAEPVEACNRTICDAKRGSAASVIVRFCPSTGSGRTDLLAD